jgi:peptide-methionine (S)-S-oxide reductase
VETFFQQIQGVREVISGYAGGETLNPTYTQICTGTTGHAEVVKIVFDPAQVGLEDLLRIFFTVHDPTTPNRQGNDVGTQYRSVIFPANETQKAVALKIKQEVTDEKLWNAPIVTEITMLPEFFAAEAYHQDYFANNETKNPYCQYVIAPKNRAFREKFKHKLKP